MATKERIEISDSSDWVQTSLPTIAPLDSALRCQVCKDYYTNAVITSCAHSFCSLCIRRCLHSDGQCPACRSRDQEVKLRRNVALQEVVDAFVHARAEVLAVARAEAERAAQTVEQPSRGQKRKRGTAEDSNQGSERQTRRSTRQQTRASATPASTQEQTDDEIITIEDNAEDTADRDYRPEPEDGLVPCPMCGKRMKEEQVFPHLDRCEIEQNETRSKSRSVPPAAVTNGKRAQAEDVPRPERLPALNYAIYKEQALKQKLKALGISNLGSKNLMMRRHSEWINLWNANCDSSHPVSRRELLAELDKWERSQGGLSANGGVDNSAIMKKDFDGQAWAAKNKSDFDDLIARAREKRFQKKKMDDEERTEPATNDAAQSHETATDQIQKSGSPNFDSRSRAPAAAGSTMTSRADNEGQSEQQDELVRPGNPNPRRKSMPGLPIEKSQEHAQQDAELGLAGHLARRDSSQAKTVPLFEVPQAPIADVDIGGGGGDTR